MSTNHKRWTSSPLGTGRIEAFSDGVFAVAITLLVLNIQLPPMSKSVALMEFVHNLLDVWPKFLSYALSFVIVGIYWVAHHNTFHYIERCDRILLWINILLLMCVVFIPFPAELIGQYPGQQIPVIIYGGTLVSTGFLLQLLWWYATHRYRLVKRDLSPRLVRTTTRRNLIAPFIYLLAVGVSFISVAASLVFFVFVPIFYIFPGRINWHWTHRRIQVVDEVRVAPVQDADLLVSEDEEPSLQE